jgi:nitroimidazol reductase NimA-like FMN-containing flavoprotein (pyridoxamine 5'-phosphate oxidase superfamily)
MAQQFDIKPKSEKNLSGYDLGPIAWDRVRQAMEEWHQQGPSGDDLPHTHWLATTNPDGSPHVMPIGVALHEGAYYFTSGPGTVKSKNLAQNPNCVITLAAKGMDVVVEGTTAKVTDEAKLHEIAEAFADWGPKVENGAFVHEYSAPSAGPPPWDVYEITPKTVYGLATSEPYGATRWRV